MELEPLEKTTFWVEGAELDSANLDDTAAAAAAALGFDPGEIMVVDVQPGIIAFDVLKKNIPAESVAGKAREILGNLGGVPGISLHPGASVHSEGVLGLIALDPQAAREVISRSAEIGQAMAGAVAKRACVFSSGAEVISGKIEDTNSPISCVKPLQKLDLRPEFGGIIARQCVRFAVSALEAALMRGFGLIITTGGVGAESKDQSVEAVLSSTLTP